MPNYRWRIREYGVERDASSDSGKVWRMYYLYDPQELPWQGLVVRTEMMEAVGIDPKTQMPETLDEWTDMMAKLQAYYGEGKATIFPTNSGLLNTSAFLSAWDVGTDFYVDANGAVGFGPYTDAFKEYLLFMKDWNDKGYLLPDFASAVVDITTTASFLEDHSLFSFVTAFGVSRNSYVDRFKFADKTLWLEPIVSPVMNKGDVQHFRQVSSFLYNCSVVMGDTDKPVLVAKFYDWLNTDDGACILTYGEYGKHWTYDDKGLPTGTDYTKNAPAGTDFAVWKEQVNPGWSFIGVLYSDWRPLVYYGGWNRGSMNLDFFYSGEVWAKAEGDFVYPRFASLTGEESSEYNDLYVDIDTYVKEMTPQFIAGIIDIESGWNEFISTLKTMGIETCIQFKQNAYDRYVVR